VLFLLNERLGVQLEFLPQGAQELGGAVETNRRLEVRYFQGFTELAAVLSVQANVGIRVSE